MILPYIYVYRLTFTGQSWFIVEVSISKVWMVKYVLLTSHFYLVSQVECLKTIKVTFRKDWHLASIQGFQSANFFRWVFGFKYMAETHCSTCWRQRVTPLLGTLVPHRSLLLIPELRHVQVRTSCLLGIPQMMQQTWLRQVRRRL